MNLANVCLHTGKAAKPGRHAESLNRPSMPPVHFRPDPTRTGHQAAGCANGPAFQKAPYAWQTLPASLSRRNFFIPTQPATLPAKAAPACPPVGCPRPLTQIGHWTSGRLPACAMQHASGLAEGVAGYLEA